MRVLRYPRFVIGMALVLAATASNRAAGQTDTTRRVTSDQRIPVRKDGRIVRESPGDVALNAEAARIVALEETAASLQARLQTTEAELAAVTSRVGVSAASIRALEATLQTTREELFRVRYELALATARTTALEERANQFDRRMNSLRHGSLFGHSGFYMGLGTGMNFTTGTMHNVGYGAGLNVVMPIGWSKPGYL